MRPFAFVSAVLVTALGFPAAAQPAGTAPSNEQLDQKIRILERKLELAADTAAAEAAARPQVSAGSGGLRVTAGDAEFRLRGLLQLDSRWFTGEDGAPLPDTFVFRRVRPTFQGTLGKGIGFRFTPELAGDSATLIDAYLDVALSRSVTVRAGKIKGPVGLERLQGGGDTAFIERGLPTELAPNREVGLQFQGGKTLQWVLGAYNGTADGSNGPANDVDNRKEVAARLFYQPSPDLGIGIAGSTGRKRGDTQLPRYRSPGQTRITGYVAGTAFDGTHTRISPQAFIYRGAFGLLAEYIQSTQDLSLGGRSDTLTHHAWQVVGRYLLTGEKAGFGSLVPSQPYAIGKPGWGAWEIVARVGRLALDDDADALGYVAANEEKTFDTYGLGVNGYLSHNVRIAANYDVTRFRNFSGADRADERALFTRLQLAF